MVHALLHPGKVWRVEKRNKQTMESELGVLWEIRLNTSRVKLETNEGFHLWSLVAKQRQALVEMHDAGKR